jgi:hypothetical protein
MSALVNDIVFWAIWVFKTRFNLLLLYVYINRMKLFYLVFQKSLLSQTYIKTQGLNNQSPEILLRTGKMFKGSPLLIYITTCFR